MYKPVYLKRDLGTIFLVEIVHGMFLTGNFILSGQILCKDLFHCYTISGYHVCKME
jgi:hypothetical protein